MITVLSTNRLFFDATPERLVELATRYGFDAVDAIPAYFDDEIERDNFVSSVQSAGLGWGLAGLQVALGTTTSSVEFDSFLLTLSHLCPQLERAGVTTMSTWIAPANNELPHIETFQLHVDRLNRLAPILASSGLRLAMEYVAPESWRQGMRYPFLSTLDGARELIGSLADPARFGLLLDTFHWYTANESVEQIAALSSDEILAVDLNDAPPNLRLSEQEDMERAQPGSTGVIDITGFITALRSTGYRGIVQSEPFSAALAAQPEEERVADARAALATVLQNT